MHMLAIDSSLGVHVQPLQIIGSFASCNSTTRTEEYHLERTLSNAIARNQRRPCSNLVSVYEKFQTQDSPSLWGSALSLDPLLAPVGDLVNGLQTDAWSIRFIIHHLTSCSKDSVDGDFDSSSPQRNQIIPSASLFLNPRRLHFSSLVLVVVTSFTVGPDLLTIQSSIFTGTSRDTEFLKNWSLHNLSSE